VVDAIHKAEACGDARLHVFFNPLRRSITCILAYGLCSLGDGLFLTMYLKISNMFRTLLCAVFSTTISKLSIYILLSDIVRHLHFSVRTVPNSLNC
jgi:hypothetical protein